jgi:FixJ family two-component response regulator
MNEPHYVVVVDDDESVRKALMRLLRVSNLDARSFGSGQEFLASVKNRLPECLILDIQMPVMNGFQVRDQLHQSGFDIPIIFITAHDSESVHQQALAEGTAGYLRKPFSGKELLDIVTRAVGPPAE